MKISKEKLKSYFKPENFFNRDLSWVEFNRRVLDEALNQNLPILEKVKFISIFFSNLDEFYMIRVSGYREQIRAKIIEPTIDGITPLEEIKKIQSEVNPMLAKIYKYWSETIKPELKNNNIELAEISELKENEISHLEDYFHKEIYPVLTPLAFDPGRPFPYISNLSLSFAILIKKPNGERHFARVKVPSILPRLLRIDEIIPSKKIKEDDQFSAKYIWLDDLIKHNIKSLFPGVEVLEAHKFRITRNTDLEIQEDEADDLLELIEENIKQRKFGSVVRLEVEKDMPDFMLQTLSKNLEISDDTIHVINGPLGLSDIMALYGLPFPQLKDKPFHSVMPKVFEEDDNLFSLIKKHDTLLHHPYESFSPVIDFIKKASQDPKVLAIKQTLYRVGQDSPMVKALIEAAERKKQVAVLVELKARFDEENNIYWARELEKAGVHVVYGLLGLKTHSKMTLVVRKENDGVKRYVHLGTGNYNASTAKLYTDLGLFSADEALCSDVSEVFNYLTGYSEQKKFRKLIVAPINIRPFFYERIEREIAYAKEGKKGKLIFKMNSLVDPILIAAMYKASQAGVKIELIVRGICCLVPQVPGLSENITVRSIVGRFLEHSRIYYFHNDGNEEIFLGSADIMPRNLDRRVETLFPIEDNEIKKRIKETIIDIALKDNCQARILLPTGKYIPNSKDGSQKNISLQEFLMDYANQKEINSTSKRKK